MTQTNLLNYFTYSDGKLYWRKRLSNKIKVGDEAGAGSKSNVGYNRVGVSGKRYQLHRLVWLYHKGYIPENGIDHINQDKWDNRIENLREASHQCNARNCGNHKDNSSGVRGVSFNKSRWLWEAYVSVNGNRKNLGRYDSFEEAVLSRLAAEQCLGWSECNLNSPAYLFYIENIKGV